MNNRQEQIEQARRLIATGISEELVEVLRQQFPELKESEDEKIRKELYEFIKVNSPTEDANRFIAWLEKQKEQKPAELPKSEDYGIDGLYAAVDILQKTLGEVEGYQSDDGILEHKCAISAVKELYEQKPAEWSEEDNIGWDEAFACVTRVEKAAKNEEELQNAVTAEKWLKEIKFKYCVHPIKQEWSEDGERKLNRIYEILGHAADDKGFLTSKRIIGDNEAIELQDFLKSLRPQPKEDLNAIAQREYARGKQDGYWEGVKAERESCKTFHYESPNWPPKMPDLPTETTTNEGVSSIQPHWKPSEEQIGALNYAYCELFKREDVGHNILGPLQKLIDDLEKLL